MIAAERARQPVTEFLRAIQRATGDQEVALSAIGYTELLHGLHREVDPARRQRREVFFTDLLAIAAVEPYTEDVAELAGRILGEQALAGNNIPFVDLMIGATALHRGYSVLTANLRHFRMVPSLQVLEL